MQITNRSVWITTSFIGFHKWLEAPEEVAYLSHPHRHKFGVSVEVELDKARKERQVEFHLLKALVDAAIKELPCGDPPSELEWSCEDISGFLAGKLINSTFPIKAAIVSVSEDAECGARIRVERNIP